MNVRIVLVSLAAHLAERALNPEAGGSAAAEVVASLAMSLPLLVARTRPVWAAVGVAAGGALNQLLGATDVNETFVVIATLIYVGYCATRWSAGLEGWLALAVLGGGVMVVEALLGDGGLEFVVFVIGGGAVGGTLVRRHAELTRQLAERTHELDALRAQRARDAMLDERRRIARELHDVVAHTVSVMVVQAGGARAQAALDPARALAALDQVEATGTETLAELRRLFGLLHPGAGRGLGDLDALVARTRAAGLDVTLSVTGSPAALAPDAALAAYRLVQEALTNTLKHAGPGAAATVDVIWSAAAVEVVVRDTGWGVAGPRGDGTRRGLVGMRERVEQVGGQVAAGPCPDGGFEVRATVPVARQEVQVA